MFRLIKRSRVYQHGRISVTNSEVRKRLEFHGLTEEDLGVIAAWSDVCKGAMDVLVDKFYAHVLNNSDTAQILRKHSSIERQRPMLTRYILTMFSGIIDDPYVEYRKKVGEVHDHIELDSNWFVAMYEVIRQVLTEAVKSSGGSRADVDRFKEALQRFLQADIALVVMFQTNSHKEKIGKLTDEVNQKFNEAKRFLDAESDVLEKVSARDLSYRMEGNFEGHYANIQSMLNTTIDSLYNSISQISVGADQVASAASEISMSSQSLAQGASEQAATLEEMSANFHEMISMSNRNVENAKTAKELTSTARNSADKGGESMSQLSEAMSKIKHSSDSTAKIVKTIEEIAFQTNLLALNAAVEAARAGDAGKGFAVVAEEVRNLAMRSAEAAKTTAQLIDESVKNTQSGVSLNEQVLQNLNDIRVQVGKVSEMMSEIALDSNAQHQTIESINQAIDQLNSVTQQTAASSEETASASEELSAQSQEMLGIVSTFKFCESDKRSR